MSSLLNISFISVGVAVVAKSMSWGMMDNMQGSTIGVPVFTNVIPDVYLTPYQKKIARGASGDAKFISILFKQSSGHDQHFVYNCRWSVFYA